MVITCELFASAPKHAVDAAGRGRQRRLVGATLQTMTRVPMWLRSILRALLR